MHLVGSPLFDVLGGKRTREESLRGRTSKLFVACHPIGFCSGSEIHEWNN